MENTLTLDKKPTFDYRLKYDAINGHIPEPFKGIVTNKHIANWKKLPWTKYIGYNYYDQKHKDLEIINTDLRNLNKEINALKEELKKVRVENEVLHIVKSTIEKEYAETAKNKIIEYSMDKGKILGIKKWSKILDISEGTFQKWKQIYKKKCEHSTRFTCIKSYRNQLTKEEELKIIQLLQDPRYEHLPIISLRWKAHYENIVHASDTTWVKIQKENQLIRNKPIKRVVRRKIPLRAKYSNQYLHADITHFKLPDNKTYYIYVVKDNYSKFIKSWYIANKINSDLRIKTFKDAIKDIDDANTQQVTFITDMGRENANTYVKDYFKQFQNIDIKYAQRDIPYSNCMVERFNMDLKYMYLYRDTIKSYRELNQLVAQAVHEHNYIKRLGILKGQTPYEVYNGISPNTEWINEKWQEAKVNRKRMAKNTICCITKL